MPKYKKKPQPDGTFGTSGTIRVKIWITAANDGAKTIRAIHPLEKTDAITITQKAGRKK